MLNRSPLKVTSCMYKRVPREIYSLTRLDEDCLVKILEPMSKKNKKKQSLVFPYFSNMRKNPYNQRNSLHFFHCVALNTPSLHPCHACCIPSVRLHLTPIRIHRCYTFAFKAANQRLSSVIHSTLFLTRLLCMEYGTSFDIDLNLKQ